MKSYAVYPYDIGWKCRNVSVINDEHLFGSILSVVGLDLPSGPTMTNRIGRIAVLATDFIWAQHRASLNILFPKQMQKLRQIE